MNLTTAFPQTGLEQSANDLSAAEVSALRLRKVVVLTNFLRRLHVDVLEQVQDRVGKLTVLLSTPMEPDRNWSPEWGNLDVVVQKNWTLVRKWRHSRGFHEDNFIHLPYDTLSQLRRLQPDAVASFELGFRTFISSLYTRRRVPLIAVGNMSEQIERERGLVRRCLRKLLLSRIDCFTFNGPSCRRYLEWLGAPDYKLQPFPYFYDRQKVSLEAKEFSTSRPKRLLFSGNLTLRKGIQPLAIALKTWALAHPAREVELRVCGTGPEASHFSGDWPPNLQVELLGACNDQQLSQAYNWADLCLFPTLADEWGLVPIEAFASGCPVVGSRAAQSMEVYGREGINGWFYDADDPEGLSRALDRGLDTPRPQLDQMSRACRETVRAISAADCSVKFCRALLRAQANFARNSNRPTDRVFSPQTR